MFSKYYNRKGLILIELIIIVVIIGLNTGCTENRITQTTVDSVQSDVVGTLRLIYTQEQAYYLENDVFIACADHNALLNNIGVEIPDGDFYVYCVCVAGNGFIAVATANLDEDAAIDTWTIDQYGVITNTINDVTYS